MMYNEFSVKTIYCTFRSGSWHPLFLIDNLLFQFFIYCKKMNEKKINMESFKVPAPNPAILRPVSRVQMWTLNDKIYIKKL